MPIYEYLCGTCHASTDVYQSIHSDPLTACPCGGPLKRVLYPPTLIDATPKTLGSLADKNSRPSYWLDEQRRLSAERMGRPENPEKPFWDTPDCPALDEGTMRKVLDDPATTERYIMTGKTTESLTPEITS